MTDVIITSQCEFCEYGIVDDTNKARVMVSCDYKNKQYYYGQCIQCENFKKRGRENE